MSDIEAIVVRHAKCKPQACAVRAPTLGHPWPCDTRVLADALAAAEALGLRAYQVAEDIRRERNAAEADADALAAALREMYPWLRNDMLPMPAGERAAFDAGIAALAAHAARRK